MNYLSYSRKVGICNKLMFTNGNRLVTESHVASLSVSTLQCFLDSIGYRPEVLVRRGLLGGRQSAWCNVRY
jgi:hypothetical protein